MLILVPLQTLKAILDKLLLTLTYGVAFNSDTPPKKIIVELVEIYEKVKQDKKNKFASIFFNE